MKKVIILMAVFSFVAFAGCKCQTDVPVGEQVKKTVTCDTEENNCSVTCQSGCCLAIYWPDTKECSTSCDCEKNLPITKGMVNENAKVILIAKNVKLSTIAMAFNIKNNKVFVPAEKINSTVTVSIKNVSLKKALKSLGLVITPASK